MKAKRLDYDSVINRLSDGIAKYVSDNKLESLVIGLSGGLDSTVCAALCKIAKTKLQNSGSDVKIIGASLPTSTNQASEEDTARDCSKFCDVFIDASLQQAFDSVASLCEKHQMTPSTPISLGNIKARLRMIFLYNLASLYRGIVIDTDNLTECFLGFWTIHGDEGDFNPIGCLWKTEVYELAKALKSFFAVSGYQYRDSYVKSLQKSIDATPTDGNGVMDGGDLAQIAPGHTYDDVDDILTNVLLDSSGESIKALEDKYDAETVSRVVKRYKASAFKRKHRPFIIDLEGKVTTKDRNIVPWLARC